MKHVKLFEEYKINEMWLKTEKAKLDNYVAKIVAKIKDTAVAKEIERFAAMHALDPYQNLRTFHDHLVHIFQKKVDFNLEDIAMESLQESWNLSSNIDNLYVVKSPGEIESKGGMTSNKPANNNVLGFVPGDVLLVTVQSGSLGDRYGVYKVEVEGNDINFLSPEVVIWQTEYSLPDWFKSLEKYKK